MTKPVKAKQIATLLDEHAGALALYASQWAQSPDDCVQEAFVELAGQTACPENPVAWLYRVVRNRAINELRSRQRRNNREKTAARLDAQLNDPAARFLVEDEQKEMMGVLKGMPEKRTGVDRASNLERFDLGRSRETKRHFIQFGAAAIRGCTRENETSIGVKMPDETRMNHESQLPDDLAQLETSLTRIALPSSNLDRDELMYQSGWAAAMAERDSLASNSPIKRATKFEWAWPAATLVATAASVLFCGLFVWQMMFDSGLNVAQGGDKMSSSVVSLDEPDAELKVDQVPQLEPLSDQGDLLELVMEYPSNRKLATGFVLFDASLQLPAEAIAPATGSTPSLLATPKNRFELMQELLDTPANQNRPPYL